MKIQETSFAQVALACWTCHTVCYSYALCSWLCLKQADHSSRCCSLVCPRPAQASPSVSNSQCWEWKHQSRCPPWIFSSSLWYLVALYLPSASLSLRWQNESVALLQRPSSVCLTGDRSSSGYAWCCYWQFELRSEVHLGRFIQSMGLLLLTL